jgi:hypothetical protein
LLFEIHYRPFSTRCFEDYGKRWIKLVNRFEEHHGYFLPSEGANNIAFAMFSFPSLTEYENYRLILKIKNVLKHLKLQRIRLLSYERTFFAPSI